LLAGKADVMPWGFPCNRTANGACQVGVPKGTVNIENRHFVVDETMEAVAVFCTFGVDPASGGIRTPDADLFRIENGKVRFVQAITHLLDAADAGQE
jgi:ketosteroid isomerase-like protein